MGKDKKKDKKKQGKGAEKTALKTAKKAAKREAKERSKSGLPEEEDIESILNQLAAKDRDRKVVTEETSEQPTPRVHASFTCNPLKDNEFFLFGGEYYNGERVFVYNHLFRLKDNKGVLTWSQVTSPNTPKPRSSHQAVASRSHLYIFGGEFTSPSQMQFYHHKDMWRLDAVSRTMAGDGGEKRDKIAGKLSVGRNHKQECPVTTKWTSCDRRGGDKDSDGEERVTEWREKEVNIGEHFSEGVMQVLWKNSMFVFGGFYDTGHDVRYFNDAFLFDFGEMKWKKLGEDKRGDNVSWPSPRSACGIGEFEDTIFVYGGYTKHGRSFSSSDDSHGIVHTDMWSLDPRAVVWTKVRKGGIPPSPRCGFSTCVHKKRNLVVFGGVYDEYSKHDLSSTFFNDIFVFRMDQRRWFPVTLRSKKKASGRRQKTKEEGSLAADNDGQDGEQGMGEGADDGEEEDMEFLGKKKMKKIKNSMSRARQQDNEGSESGESNLEEEEEEVEEEEVDGESENEEQSNSTETSALRARVQESQEDEMEAERAREVEGKEFGAQQVLQEQGQSAEQRGHESQSKDRDGDDDGSIASLMPSLFKEKKEEDKRVPDSLELQMPEDTTETAQVAAEEDTNSTRPMKRINSHLQVRGNELFIFGGKVDADRREVTLDDIWTLDMSKLSEYKLLQPLSAAASFWVEDEDEDDGEEEEGSWDSDEMDESGSENEAEDESDEDDEGGEETGENKVEEADGDGEDEDEKAETALSAGKGGVEKSLQEAVQTMTDEEVVNLFLTEDRNLKELLFLRSLDPSRYLEVTMKVKSERLKTPEEREREELARQESKRREEEAAAAAIASMSREARRRRGIELRTELSNYAEEEIPKDERPMGNARVGEQKELRKADATRRLHACGSSLPGG
eukprot:82417-Hanusia_phi.AAC.1